MTVKTDLSRFHIHDELTAPEGSVKILKGVQGAGSVEVPKFIGVLAGSPAALRSYARMRHELRSGVLPRASRERIALAVAEHRGDPYSISQYARSARAAGLGLDEVSLARSFKSSDEKEAALLAFVEALIAGDGRPSKHFAEEAREAGWSDEELLEAIANVAMTEFQSLVANAAELPQDHANSTVLPNAA
jgi:alkylhydroperoxidase family enzyme